MLPELGRARAAILSEKPNVHKLPAEFAATWDAAFATVAAVVADLAVANHIQTDLSPSEFLDNSLVLPLM